MTLYNNDRLEWILIYNPIHIHVGQTCMNISSIGRKHVLIANRLFARYQIDMDLTGPNGWSL